MSEQWATPVHPGGGIPAIIRFHSVTASVIKFLRWSPHRSMPIEPQHAQNAPGSVETIREEPPAARSGVTSRLKAEPALPSRPTLTGRIRRGSAAVFARWTRARQPAELAKDVGKALLLGLAYYVAAVLSLRMALVGGQVTPIWPPTGIALVGLLYFGRRVWPGIAIGAFLVNAPIGPSLFTAAGVAAGNTLAPLLAAILLQRAGFRQELDRLRDALAIVFVGALSVTVSATGGSTSLLLSGSVPPSEFWSTWFVWWTGDAMGLFLVAPFLLSLRRAGPGTGIGWRRAVEAGSLFGGLAIVAYLVFQSRLHVEYLVFPFLAWAALRFQQRGAAPAALLASAIAIWAAVNRTGPFMEGMLLERMVTLQVFNGTAALASFVLAAVVAERNHDVDKRRIAEEERAESERKFRTLFEAGADSVVLIDSRGTIWDVNPAASVFLGREREALIGVNVSEIFPPEERSRAREYFRGVLSDDPGVERFEAYAETASGRRFVHVRSRLIREFGAGPYVQVIARDMTEEKQMQARLVESERRASMGQVAAYIAHEIRTPLTNVALLAGTIAKRTQDPDIRARIEKINVQRRLAAEIIDNLLTLTRTGEVHAVETDLRTVIQAASEQVASVAKDGVDFRKEIGEASAVALVDPLRLRQAVANLLRNAFQATRQGSVNVRLERRVGEYGIVVQDTGPGIPEGIRDKIFEPFFTTKEPGQGTGLGLSFAKGVAEAHHGRIELASDPGHGCTFTIVLPHGPHAHEARKQTGADGT
jgi:PAS domain S-box-containing protein